LEGPQTRAVALPRQRGTLKQSLVAAPHLVLMFLNWQLVLQQEDLAKFPKPGSHCSPVSTTPSPQIGGKVTEGVMVLDPVPVPVPVPVTDEEDVSVSVDVIVAVLVTVTVTEFVTESVTEGVIEFVTEGVNEFVTEGVTVTVTEGVKDGELLGVSVGSGDGVGVEVGLRLACAKTIAMRVEMIRNNPKARIVKNCLLL